MMRAELPMTNPAMAAATPESEFSNEMTTGMSAPPIGVTPRMPRAKATATINQ